MSRLRKKIWTPDLLGSCPHWQNAVKRVRVDVDLQRLRFIEIDWLFAVFASNGWTQFVVCCNGAKYEQWLNSVDRRSAGAAEKYERRIKAHFQRYKHRFTEGHSLPERPTPELRVIYDSAGKSQGRPKNPCGTTLHSGFDGGEYHWRSWPLNNVTVSKGGSHVEG